jgi:hypothetical protein
VSKILAIRRQKVFHYLNWTSIWVEPVLEELRKELLIEAVDSIVKGQEDKLGDVLWLVATRNVASSAIAVWQAAITWVTGFSLLLSTDTNSYD